LGQGWHRDSIGKQFKSILFLTAVEINSDPFEIFKGCHSFCRIVLDSHTMGVPEKNDRLSSSEIEQVKQNHKPTKVVGCAGTLLLVDTSTIHRGAPILIGSRYTLTNHYYSRYEIANLFNDFGPQR
jgi:hypothetical protein